MKLPKTSAILAAAALAPTVLFPSMASAAEQPKPAGVSGPDTASDAAGDNDSAQEERDRAEVQRILADKESGTGVREAAEKALAGSATDLRHFLQVELPKQRRADNKLKVAQFLNTGGPAVRKAAEAALFGTNEDILNFLREGQYTARAEDEANAAAAAKPTTPVQQPDQADNTGTGQSPSTDRTAPPVQAADVVSTNTNPAPTAAPAPAPAAAPVPLAITTPASSGQLAATGTDEGLDRVAGGAAAAIAAGAALVAISRRRQAAEIY
ncbi:ALF repeat-containing protein [Kitasatospora sp. NPDC058170]|uniref:ALF repeat-containing protein n=1 Tax=Kitasatospora sp. NPDC058170 TaxID=3346364 RepID=UPI0036D8B0D0